MLARLLISYSDSCSDLTSFPLIGDCLFSRDIINLLQSFSTSALSWIFLPLFETCLCAGSRFNKVPSTWHAVLNINPTYAMFFSLGFLEVKTCNHYLEFTDALETAKKNKNVVECKVIIKCYNCLAILWTLSFMFARIIFCKTNNPCDVAVTLLLHFCVHWVWIQKT